MGKYTRSPGPMVYIGKKGDANLDGKVDSTDIYELMRYIAYVGAGFSDTKLLETSPDAADENLSVLAYFLADADTESTEGKNTAEKRLDPQDMFYVMYYVANRGCRRSCDLERYYPVTSPKGKSQMKQSRCRG